MSITIAWAMVTAASRSSDAVSGLLKPSHCLMIPVRRFIDNSSLIAQLCSFMVRQTSALVVASAAAR